MTQTLFPTDFLADILERVFHHFLLNQVSFLGRNQINFFMPISGNPKFPLKTAPAYAAEYI